MSKIRVPSRKAGRGRGGAKSEAFVIATRQDDEAEKLDPDHARTTPGTSCSGAEIAVTYAAYRWKTR